MPARDGSLTTIVVAESAGGVRTVAQSADPAVGAQVVATDLVGTTVELTAPGEFSPA